MALERQPASVMTPDDPDRRPDDDADQRPDDRAEFSEQRQTRQSAGITLIALLLSIGLTVGFGISGPWWLRVSAGIATTLSLGLVVKASSHGTSALRRFADWMTATPTRPPR